MKSDEVSTFSDTHTYTHTMNSDKTFSVSKTAWWSRPHALTATALAKFKQDNPPSDQPPMDCTKRQDCWLEAAQTEVLGLPLGNMSHTAWKLVLYCSALCHMETCLIPRFSL